MTCAETIANIVATPEWLMTEQSKIGRWPGLGIITSIGAAATAAIRLVVSVALTILGTLALGLISPFADKNSDLMKKLAGFVFANITATGYSIGTLTLSVVNIATLGFANWKYPLSEEGGIVPGSHTSVKDAYTFR